MTIQGENQNITKSLSYGGAWMIIMRSGVKVLNFIKLIVMARLLKPYDFGVVAVAMVFAAALEAFSQTGFTEALIQKKEGSSTGYDCAWTALLLRGIFLATVMSLCANLTARMFKIPQAGDIAQLMALCFIFQGLTSIGITRLLKDLDFKKYFACDILASIGDFIVSITAAIILKNAWALVFGMVTRDFLKMIISYIVSPYQPRLRLDIAYIKELFKFGKWMFGSSVFGFIIAQIDSIFVARLLGASAIGAYQMAQKISNVPATEIAHISNQLTMPAYSKIQDNPKRLKTAYLKVLELTAFFIFFLAGLIVIMGDDFIKIFLGKQWGSLSSILIIMTIAGTLRAVAATGGAIFLAVGKPKIDTFWQSIRLVVIAALIYPLTYRWSTLGAAIALLASTSISSLGFCYAITDVLKCSWKNFTKTILTGFLSALTGVALIYFLKQKMTYIDIPAFFSLTLAFTAIYALASFLINKWLGYNLLTIFKEIYRQLRIK
jgi:O-antigen/teichoic acid export membrane protein